MSKFIPYLILFMLIPSLCFGEVDLDGDNDYIDLGAAFTTPTALTLMIRAKEETNNISDYYWSVLQSGDGTLAALFWIQGGAGAGTVVFAINGSTGNAQRVSNSGVADKAGNIYIATTDGSSTGTNIHIYKNCTEVSYASSSDESGGFVSGVGSHILAGRKFDSARNYDGQMTEVALWSVELTATDREELCNSKGKRMALQIQPSNLVYYLPMDECADGATCSGADQFQDLSGNGNHGTAINGPVGFAEKTLTYQ